MIEIKSNLIYTNIVMNIYDAKYYRKKNGYMMDTADAVVFSLINDKLSILLIKRKNEPYKDHWALPGGYIEISKDEDVLASVKRELFEETGLEHVFLEQFKTYTKKNRDPRELQSNEKIRIFSIAHYALIDFRTAKGLKAGSDAKEYKWFPIKDLPKQLAFDHLEIIQDAVQCLKERINYREIAFSLVPEIFTIPELQKIIESILDEKLNRNNFRTKLLKLGILTKKTVKPDKKVGKPPQYYTLNKEQLKKIFGQSLFK